MILLVLTYFIYVVTVADINECESVDVTRQHRCDVNSTLCVNMPGSYSCQCSRGFTPRNGVSCDGMTTKRDEILLLLKTSRY